MSSSLPPEIRLFDDALRGTPTVPPELVAVAKQAGGLEGVAIVATDLFDRSVSALTHDVVMHYVAKSYEPPDTKDWATFPELLELGKPGGVDQARLDELAEHFHDPLYVLQFGLGFHLGTGAGVEEGIRALWDGLVDAGKMAIAFDKWVRQKAYELLTAARAGKLDREALDFIADVEHVATKVRPMLPGLLRAADDPGRIAAVIAAAAGREWLNAFLALNGSPRLQGMRVGALVGRACFEFVLVAIDFIPGLQEKAIVEAIRGLRWLAEALVKLAELVKGARGLKILGAIAKDTATVAKDVRTIGKLGEATVEGADAVKALERAAETAGGVGADVKKAEGAVEKVEVAQKVANAATDARKATSTGSIVVEGAEAAETVVDEATAGARALAADLARARKAREEANAAAKALQGAGKAAKLAPKLPPAVDALVKLARRRLPNKAYVALFDDFVRLFHWVPGFEKLVADIANGARTTSQGAIFVMRYCATKFADAALLFEQPAMVLKALNRGGSLRERAARITDVIAMVLDDRFQKVRLFIEFKSWTEASLKLGKAKLLEQLRLDIVAYGLDNLRWVFDATKANKKVVYDTMRAWLNESEAMKKLIGAAGGSDTEQLAKIDAFLRKSVEVF